MKLLNKVIASCILTSNLICMDTNAQVVKTLESEVCSSNPQIKLNKLNNTNYKCSFIENHLQSIKKTLLSDMNALTEDVELQSFDDSVLKSSNLVVNIFPRKQDLNLLSKAVKHDISSGIYLHNNNNPKIYTYINSFNPVFTQSRSGYLFVNYFENVFHETTHYVIDQYVSQKINLRNFLVSNGFNFLQVAEGLTTMYQYAFNQQDSNQRLNVHQIIKFSDKITKSIYEYPLDSANFHPLNRQCPSIKNILTMNIRSDFYRYHCPAMFFKFLKAVYPIEYSQFLRTLHYSDQNGLENFKLLIQDPSLDYEFKEFVDNYWYINSLIAGSVLTNQMLQITKVIFAK